LHNTSLRGNRVPRRSFYFALEGNVGKQIKRRKTAGGIGEVRELFFRRHFHVYESSLSIVKSLATFLLYQN
jgi:hypothetical protein